MQNAIGPVGIDARDAARMVSVAHKLGLACTQYLIEPEA